VVVSLWFLRDRTVQPRCFTVPWGGAIVLAMDTSVLKIIEEIRDRIQFLTTVEIFFSAFLALFFKTVGSSESISNDVALIWGVGVAISIINYLAVGNIVEPKQEQLAAVRLLISLNLLLFVPLFVLLTTVSKTPLPGYFISPFQISFWGTLVLPILTFAAIVGIQYWQGFRWLRAVLCRKK
jgi:hypothetical protein